MDRSVGEVGVSVGKIGGWCTQVLVELVDAGIQWERWVGQHFGPLTHDF